ncbi:MAG: rod shape-determining protein MreD [Paludibacteraceae bacterium]|nr:rod shape-determining protein MreD [Paludibacteraceae bacterium]
MNIWIKSILRLIIVVLLQVFLFNNLQMGGICTPMVYILFLIALPKEVQRWQELLIGAALGFIIDCFTNTLGVNMSACILLCYLRPLLIKSMTQEYERLNGEINSDSLGFGVYAKLVTILTFAHHTTAILLESFTTSHLWLTLIQIVISSALTILLLLGYELLRKR